MRALLDTSVLIALLDPSNLHHAVASDWFDTEGHVAWATCPIVENGAIRIIAQSAYPNTVAPEITVKALGYFSLLQGYEFWPDHLSLTDSTIFNVDRLGSHRRLTDIYLLGLASARGGLLITLDARMSSDAVNRGQGHLKIIG